MSIFRDIEYSKARAVFTKNNATAKKHWFGEQAKGSRNP
jgi:hypothetical protein